ncbi:MAG: hypothetical protein ABEJ60_01360 [Halodesulfurarchaeum sp.]
MGLLEFRVDEIEVAVTPKLVLFDRSNRDEPDKSGESSPGPATRLVGIALFVSAVGVGIWLASRRLRDLVRSC